jgi:hypothetical protein
VHNDDPCLHCSNLQFSIEQERSRLYILGRCAAADSLLLRGFEPGYHCVPQIADEVITNCVWFAKKSKERLVAEVLQGIWK